MNTSRLLAFLAAALGTAGILVALAMIVFLWMTVHRLGTALDRVEKSGNRTIENAASTLGQFAGRLDDVDNRLIKLPEALAASNESSTTDSPGPGEQASLLARAAALQAASQELNAWSNSTRLSSTRLDDASSTLSDFPIVPDKAPRTLAIASDRLEELAASLEGTATNLDKLHQSLSTLARAGQLPTRPRESVDKLVSATSERVQQVRDRITTATTNLREAHASLAGFHARTLASIRWIAALLTALLLWLGAGQASLLLLGLRSLHH